MNELTRDPRQAVNTEDTMKKYIDKKVVITGGTSGIGLATAKLLRSEGARVILTGRTDGTVGSAGEELGTNAIVMKSDAASLIDIEALVARVKSEFGSLDALLICAGQTRFAPFTDTTEDVYDGLFDVNAKGPYFTVQKLAPLMSEGGAVVVVTSVANVIGQPMISAYAASKPALRSMVRSLARELLPRRIRVNAVSPGPIDSGILEKAMPKEAANETKQKMTEQNPMKRFGRPEEVAKALIFPRHTTRGRNWRWTGEALSFEVGPPNSVTSRICKAVEQAVSTSW
jgi:NAD(P)-dependent dehydrogenase (short-subunit alcohol dehydrogenase family)